MRFRRTTWLAVGLGSFLIGLINARFQLGFASALIFLTALPFVFTIKKKNILSLISIAMFLFTCGWARGSHIHLQLADYARLYDQRVVLVGRVDSDAVYDERGQLTFDLARVQSVEPFNQELVGKVKVAGFGTNSVYRGDSVQVEGKLRSTLGSRQGAMSFADIQLAARSDSLIENIRRRFVAGMYSSLPEPHGSFGLGLLIGQRSTLPEGLTMQLAAVGLTHIVAVSGYNLTILVRGTRRIFKSRSKYQTLIFSLLLIGSFLLMTGLSASIVRAAIVSGLSLWAWYYGRRLRPLLLILLAASITAGWNPLYIWFDLGWYLSFLAFYGVLVLAPMLTRRLYGAKKPKLYSHLIMESFCAQIMTAPMILYVFQEISIIALLANVLIVPLIPLAMLFGLVAGTAGMALPLVASWAAWPAMILMTFILDVVHILSDIPGSLAKASISKSALTLVYGALILISVVLWRKLRSKSDTITPELVSQNEEF